MGFEAHTQAGRSYALRLISPVWGTDVRIALRGGNSCVPADSGAAI